MNNIQIGLLLPDSTIFPISKDFEKGFISGLGETAANTTIVKEFIGQGGTKQVEQAINKFFNYDEVDMVTGIISGRVTEYVAPKFLSAKKPLLVSELGEFVPNPSALNKYIFINSHHMWQHAWALGNWGVQTFGKKGMLIGSVYDAAYCFSRMFYEGMMAADAGAEWSFSIPPNPPAGMLSDISVIFPYLEKYQPDFVFATFCGTEATLFLKEFIKHGWHKKTKLTGLPFLLAPFEPLDEDITVYTTLPNAGIPEMTAKESFYHLGYRAGSLISPAGQYNDLYEGLLLGGAAVTVGETNFIRHTDSITIVENSIEAYRKDIAQRSVYNTAAFPMEEDKLKSMVNELKTGWLNPYLCI